MRSSTLLAGVPLLFIATAQAGPGSANPFGGKRALVIGIDGLRSDALKLQVETGHAPNIAGLITEGTVTWSGVAGGRFGTPTQQPTISGPGWTSILTGTWTNLHNVVDNSTPAYNQPGVSGSYLVNQAPHFARRLEEAAPGTYSSSITSWNWIEDYLVAAQPAYLDYHTKGTGANYAARDADVKTKALAHLSNADPDVLFLHFDQVDGAGHSYGFSTTVPNYLNAIETVDGLIGEVKAAIAARPERASEQWLIVLTTDHGGTAGGSHGGQSDGERTIPFIVSGDGIPVGLSTATPGQAAVPPTVMRYFGLGLPTAWNFAEDGFVTGASLDAVPGEGAVNLSWSLPTSGIPGLSGFELLRDGSVIATLPLGTSTFSDTSALPGIHLYELALGGTNEATLKKSVTVPNPGQRVWDDSHANNNWNTVDANWSSGTTFTHGNDALFAGAGETVTVDAAGVIPAASIVSSGSYGFGGGPIGGTLAKSGSGSLTLSSANAFTATSIGSGPDSQSAGAIHIGNVGALGGGPVSIGSTNMTALYFPPSAGSGTLPNDIQLPAPSTAVTTRLLTDETNLTVTLGGVISGGGSSHEILIDNDSPSSDQGKIRLTSASNSFTSSRIRINRGGLVVTADGVLGNPANDLFLDVTGNLANSGLVLEGPLTLGSGRALTIASQTVIDTQGTADTIAGPLTYTGQMVKRGSAALRLDGAGSGTGGTSLTEGSITLGNAAGLGNGTLHVAATASLGFLNTTPLTGSTTLANPIILPADTSATNRTVLMAGGSGRELALNGVISGGSANTTLYLNTSLSGDTAATFLLNGVNTFTGKTQLNRGSLTINSNASLGAPANPLVIDANIGSKLSFTSGMGFTHPLTLSTTTVLDTADHTITTSAPVAGTAAFTKLGTGTLALAASNTHTGAITIGAGTLAVNGSVASSTNPLTVANAARLSGTGTVSRPVNVSGTLAPGDGTGTLTISAGLTMGPASSLDFQLADWTGTPGSGHDTLAVSSLALTATPAAKFTVNLNASGLTNFNGSSKSFVLASGTVPVSGLAADNWSISTSGFSFSGIWSLEASGNDLLLRYTSADGFSSWAAGSQLEGADAGFSADPDQDGIPNGLEFIFGSVNGQPSATDLPTLLEADDHVVFSFKLADAAAYLEPLVEYSTSLSTPWTTARDGVLGVSIVTLPADADGKTVQVTIPKNAAASLFARLRVEAP
ncbi:alkaline phosphatase family protein [Luteolibacter sp. GHJ8]|uniref:Alkaline phosphatase family protein n=1 Tax=Luteolibacter rhizosphaerae TaxID=2989719 RepID=A0ABT3G2L8_9BACT|nr:alkaline phosphatase family protein [Luteolibacter rhizosphaerae]MCW1914082.1 alkaline phosphatase family protein [Luteolibacter rhizosphaerae]